MIYQMAPLEGVTTYIFRNAYAKYYGGIDQYFTPFISPHKDKTLNGKERREVALENNKGMEIIPQILTNSSDDFLRTAEALKEYGYRHVNLNFGCPSATVTTKKKGAGILQDLNLLERFLDEIYSKADISISIKTRIGYDDAQEWEELLAVYRKFPLEQLIVHPRVRQDFYKNEPNLEAFQMAYETYQGKLIYNGNIFSKEDMEQCKNRFPNIAGVMLGRGLIAYPNLICEIQSDSQETYDKKILKAFHDEIYAQYQEIQSGDRNVLYRMKELWFYLEKSFAPLEKYGKQLKKTQKCTEYESIVNQIFSNIPLLDKEERKIVF